MYHFSTHFDSFTTYVPILASSHVCSVTISYSSTGDRNRITTFTLGCRHVVLLSVVLYPVM